MKHTATHRKQQKLIHVGDCLYRSTLTDVSAYLNETGDKSSAV